MNERYTYEYNAESRILHKEHFGHFSIEALIDSWDYAIKENLIPAEVQSFLLDYTDAVLGLNKGDENIMVAYFNAHPELFKGKKIAVVVNTPENIIHPILAQAKPKNYILTIFSTTLAANNWLML